MFRSCEYPAKETTLGIANAVGALGGDALEECAGSTSAMCLVLLTTGGGGDTLVSAGSNSGD